MSELLTGTIAPGGLTEVYTTSAIDLGTRIKDDNGNEYIFMQGVVGTSAGSWVTYDEDYVTTLLAADASGPVAVAKAAIVADRYGWYCIFGKVTGSARPHITDNSVTIGRSIQDGFVGEAATAGDVIYGAIARSATEELSNGRSTLFQIYYPFVDDQTAAH